MPPLPSPPSTVAESLRYTDLQKRNSVNPTATAQRLLVGAVQSGNAAIHQPARALVSALDTAAGRSLVQPHTTRHSKSSGLKSTPMAPVASTKSGLGPVPCVAVSQRKMFVIDTNVLLHDPHCLFRFQEHDIFISMVVLEELDRHKTGLNEVARNARQVSRHLDALCQSDAAGRLQGIPLASTGQAQAQGDLYFQDASLHLVPVAMGLLHAKTDNQILSVVQALAQVHAPRTVALVSKDINMRIKARALSLPCEDYSSDRVLGDDELLRSGVVILPPDFWQAFELQTGQVDSAGVNHAGASKAAQRSVKRLRKDGDKAGTSGRANALQHSLDSWVEGGDTYYRLRSPLVAAWQINQLVTHEDVGASPLYAVVEQRDADQATLRALKDHSHEKQAVWGVCARNREQNFALNLLLDPNIDLVTITGTAGSGKTLLALAAGLQLVLEEKRYSEIVMTRATVSVGDDIGFLPGTEEEKMQPWMGAVDDNLEVLAQVDGSAGEWGRAATQDLIRSKIKIRSLNFMRGRTFLQRFVIIDEAQNLTPKQIKTLLTRAGPGTKMVCMGNLAQIDTPYLTEGSSGLTYLVDRMQGWPHAGHITLERGERSRLADFVSESL